MFQIEGTQKKAYLAGSKSLFMDLLRSINSIYTLVAGIFLAIAILDPDQFVPLGTLTLRNLAHTSVYMAIAIFFLAAIKATGAETMVAGIFKGRENRMIVLAALVGGLAPFCSCEVIPFIAGLLALGTPLGPIMAFWLSSPLIDPPTLLITAGALGWKFAVCKAILAVGLGLMGGFTVKGIAITGYLKNPLKNSGKNISQSCCPAKPESPLACCDNGENVNANSPVWKFWLESERRHHFYDQFKTNGLFLFKWMLFAYSLESLMIQYIPAQTIASVVGGEGILPIILSALLGVPAYLNSYIAPPLVSGLIEQGMSVGSGMAFIMAGAISSVPAMVAVYALVRIRVFGLYVLLGFTGAVISGVVYNMIA